MNQAQDLEFFESSYTPEQIEASIGKGVIIQNGTFWVWNVDTSQYQDTGVYATPGPQSILTEMLADASVTWPKLAPEARKSNPNLLDNAYFIGGGSQQGGGQFPINQRGLTEYTGAAGYFIDRWRRDASTLCSVTEDGLKLTRSSNGHSAIYQYIENYRCILGQEVTASALVKGTPGTAFLFGYNPGSGGIYGSWITLDGTWQLISHTYIAPSTAPSFAHVMRFRVTDNVATAEVILAATKLELGPYQTLAYESAGGGWTLNDPAPNFTDELMRCQRYYFDQIINAWLPIGNISNNIHQLTIKYPITMRTTPAITLLDSNNNVVTNPAIATKNKDYAVASSKDDITIFRVVADANL